MNNTPEILLFPGIGLGHSQWPIEFTEPVQNLKPNVYQILPYRFPDHPESDGCFFILPPTTHTKIALITDPQTTTVQTVIYGTGVCVKTRYLGDAADAQRQRTEEIPLSSGDRLVFGPGDIYGLFSYSSGLVVRDETLPPFRPGITEVNLPNNDLKAPLSFWQIVRELSH